MQKRIQIWLLSAVAAALLLVSSGCNLQATTPSASASPSATASPSPGSGTGNDPATSPGNSVAQEAAKLYPEVARLEGKATIVLTVQGSPITIELDGTAAPITAGNFVDLVDQKFYDGLVFHRVVRQPEPFVVQGGDPGGRDPNVPVDQLGTGGYTDPKTKRPRYIPLEIVTTSGQALYGKTFDIANLRAKPKLPHRRGAIAMARSAYPDSASSQFYIALADLSFLDGNYAVFGYVTQGMDVVDKIQG
ncbi:MAG: peptidylprolyl isomerase, partial [Synechococcales bacterium]|nr:peptidylprolyl isomerase [Synechococcales bacterium]